MNHRMEYEMKLKDVSSTINLNNGNSIPCIGFGTWKMENMIAENCVKQAIECGYRHIDTAAAYENEVGVGKGIRKSEISRSEIFLTSKLANHQHGYHNALTAFDESLNRLQVDYLDLYLIHWPVIEEHKERYKEDIIETYNALETLYASGKVKNIGVSNFMIEHLDIVVNHCEVIPTINQIQFNPQCLDTQLRNYCSKNNIVVEGWSPLLQGKAMEHELLIHLSERYHTSVAQLCIRFAIQSNVIPIPKSSNEDRIRMNAHVFDFHISDEDMGKIESLQSLGRIGNEPNVARKFQVVGFK